VREEEEEAEEEEQGKEERKLDLKLRSVFLFYTAICCENYSNFQVVFYFRIVFEKDVPYAAKKV